MAVNHASTTPSVSSPSTPSQPPASGSSSDAASPDPATRSNSQEAPPEDTGLPHAAASSADGNALVSKVESGKASAPMVLAGSDAGLRPPSPVGDRPIAASTGNVPPKGPLIRVHSTGASSQLSATSHGTSDLGEEPEKVALLQQPAMAAPNDPPAFDPAAGVEPVVPPATSGLVQHPVATPAAAAAAAANAPVPPTGSKLTRLWAWFTKTVQRIPGVHLLRLRKSTGQLFRPTNDSRDQELLEAPGSAPYPIARSNTESCGAVAQTHRELVTSFGQKGIRGFTPAAYLRRPSTSQWFMASCAHGFNRLDWQESGFEVACRGEVVSTAVHLDSSIPKGVEAEKRLTPYIDLSLIEMRAGVVQVKTSIPPAIIPNSWDDFAALLDVHGSNVVGHGHYSRPYGVIIPDFHLSPFYKQSRRFVVQWYNGCTKSGDSGSLLELVNENFESLVPRRIFLGSLKGKRIGGYVTQSVYTCLCAVYDVLPELKSEQLDVYAPAPCTCISDAKPAPTKSTSPPAAAGPSQVNTAP